MIHVAYVTPTQVSGGVPMSKNEMTILEVAHSSMEMRVLPDEDIPSTMDRPTIKEYLILEDADGFEVKAVTNTMIVTQK